MGVERDLARDVRKRRYARGHDPWPVAVLVCLNRNRRERTAMVILVLTFITLFLAIFSPCLVILHRLEQTKGFSAWKERQQVTGGDKGRRGVPQE